jgi:hypothetical protein
LTLTPSPSPSPPHPHPLTLTPSPSPSPSPPPGEEFGCDFHHVQMYVDRVQPMAIYKELEAKVNALADKGSFDPFSGGMRFLGANELPDRVAEGNRMWAEICQQHIGGNTVAALDPKDFSGTGQDVIEQLIIGLGWRTTAMHEGEKTRSVLVVSQDPKGIKFVITGAKSEAAGKRKHEDSSASASAGEHFCEYDHFAAAKVDHFSQCHNGYQGISVLGFELPQDGALEATAKKYQELHPALYAGQYSYRDTRTVADASGHRREVVLGAMTVLEAYAYYLKGSKDAADTGTILRFVHRTGTYGSREGFGNPHGVLPGLEDVPAVFDGTSIPAYADHWVSNVFDRESFLKTLEDVLGFTPKVDFNAGVIAAGRARIESTVTGNDAGKGKRVQTCDSNEILKNQSQIYLPINNALSEVGHVHFFLQEYGQGVQHLASRVKDLVAFIERVNNYRCITGRGFTFLNIPRSYYGRLVEKDLIAAGTDAATAGRVLTALVDSGLLTVAGVVDLDADPTKVREVVQPVVGDGLVDAVAKAVLLGRYSNLYALLTDHFNEGTYLQIVRNKILVDVQGNDVLFQIFTCNVLQRKAGAEAPFLEFIQRVCSQKKCADGSCPPIKPGCGGFGIRNFLTLFLSIEVSKAMNDIEEATKAGDEKKKANSTTRVELFTCQLNESNPILTDISDAMTAEGDAQDELTVLRNSEHPDTARMTELEGFIKEASAKKVAGNEKLQELSTRYSNEMAALG